MANKFTRNITGIKDINKQGLETNNQNDLLSTKTDAYINNNRKYHCLTDNVKSINGRKTTVGKDNKMSIPLVIDVESDETIITTRTKGDFEDEKNIRLGIAGNFLEKNVSAVKPLSAVKFGNRGVQLSLDKSFTEKVEYSVTRDEVIELIESEGEGGTGGITEEEVKRIVSNLTEPNIIFFEGNYIVTVDGEDVVEDNVVVNLIMNKPYNYKDYNVYVSGYESEEGGISETGGIDVNGKLMEEGEDSVVVFKSSIPISLLGNPTSHVNISLNKNNFNYFTKTIKV